MPHDCELMALTGLRATHTVCTLVERFIDHVLLAQEATSQAPPREPGDRPPGPWHGGRRVSLAGRRGTDRYDVAR